MAAPIPPIARLDVPADIVAAEFMALKAKRTRDCLLAEQRHLIDPLDHTFEHLAPGGAS